MDFLARPVDFLKPLLSERPQNFDQLLAVFRASHSELRSVVGLELAAEKWEEYQSAQGPAVTFFGDLFPIICELALNTTHQPGPIALLDEGGNGTVELTAGECRFLLAHSFFLNLHSVPSATPGQYGTLEWDRLYWNDDVGVERLACQLLYFWEAGQPGFDVERRVIFERYAMDAVPDWAGSEVLIDPGTVQITTDRMEAAGAAGFVDFANRALQIHRIIPSCTQEEILFSCAPECFPGLLFCDVLADNEILLIRNVVRFVSYRGYADSFMFTGRYEGMPVFNVLVLDAVYAGHFRSAANLRDVNKAYLAFQRFLGQTGADLIATGHWGCGVFGGDKAHKFVQQVIAAQQARCRLNYSAFGEAHTAEQFQALLRAMEGKTVGRVYRDMISYVPNRTTFFPYMSAALAHQDG